MSFQAYLDAVEDKTGKTPQELIDLAAARGFGPDTKASEIVEWFKTEFGVGRGHAMAMVHVIKNGPGIGDNQPGTVLASHVRCRPAKSSRGSF